MTDIQQNQAAHASLGEDELLVKMTDVPLCLICDSPVLLMVRYGHAWENRNGVLVTGIRECLLCPLCSRGDEAAENLITLLTENEKMTSYEDLQRLGGTVAAWVESLRQRSVDQDLLTKQHEQWLQGSL
ncbi:DUF6300 family protein [Streptomyces coeruleorubidus]|uniref:DUF6300 family protein n=1 Tax=Streptomyces coeruleorubidus TaxID=116188 RepID=UPI0033C468BC